MRNISSAKLLIIFAIAFSLTTLAPSLAGTLPRVNVARADSLTSHVPWYPAGDRKSTRLNSSHGYISYAVFCLKKKKKKHKNIDYEVTNAHSHTTITNIDLR